MGEGGRGLILVGRIGAPQGVRGELRVQSFTANPADIAAYGDLTDSDGARRFGIVKLRLLRENMLAVALDGVTDRDAAAALTNIELYARRENFPAPDDDEVYVADLIGTTPVDAQGAAVGTIVAVQNFGAGDILEIVPANGGETLLVPFTKACVPDIDLAAGRVVVIPLPDDEGTAPE